MEIRAAEISAILKQQIASFGTEAEVAEVGTVLSVGDGIARVYGLDKVQSVPLPRAEGVALPTATAAQKLERRLKSEAKKLPKQTSKLASPKK